METIDVQGCECHDEPTGEVSFGAAAAEPSTQRFTRLKLWEVNPRYMCSVIGTCIDVASIRKQAKRDGICTAEIGDYDLHGLVVRFCKSRSKTSRALHKLLDRRHSGAVRRASTAKTTKDLAAFWQTAMTWGRVAEGYWALVTHPSADLALLERAFGDIHMLSHVLGATRHTSANELERSRSELEKATSDARALRDMLRKERKKRAELEQRVDQQQHRIRSLRTDLGKFSAVSARIQELEATEKVQQGQMKENSAALDSAVRRARRLESERDKMRDELLALREQRGALVAEVETLDARVCQLLGQTDGDDAGLDLDGARVLYVGGRTGLVPHYRAVVEEARGGFVHHDGGIEDARGRLTGQVRAADIVMCAMDAVSHDASLRVKLACRRFGRRFVPLRSSGVASLSAALANLHCLDADGPSYDGPTNFLTREVRSRPPGGEAK